MSRRGGRAQQRRADLGAHAAPPEGVVGIVLLDLDGRVTVANEHTARVLGLGDAAGLVGSALFEHAVTVQPDGSYRPLPPRERPAPTVARTGEALEMILGLAGPRVEPVWLRVQAQPLTSVGASTPYAVLTHLTRVELVATPPPARAVAPVSPAARPRPRRPR